MAIAARQLSDPIQTRPVLFTAPGVEAFPQFRFMGSKYRLLPWIAEVLSDLRFQSAVDAFSGSGCVSYLLKSMGKRVVSNDFLNFCAMISRATIENDHCRVDAKTMEALLEYSPFHRRFVETTFRDVFFTAPDLRFLDVVSWNIRKMQDPYVRALAIAALVRSCLKRQPRGVFTVAGDPERYKDGRRDLRLSIEEHFVEQVAIFNKCVFCNGKDHRSVCGSIFDLDTEDIDLVYMDPPYVPRADDNCYMKRYHFLEGLSCYWEGQRIMEDSRVKKIAKPYTPFSYRKSATEAFDTLFRKFSVSTLVLSYSSNGYPDLDVLVSLMHRYKKSVRVFEKEHRYHFGTHAAVRRNVVQEYLIVGVK
jgi:adenine-specific DNA-methyltransferase